MTCGNQAGGVPPPIPPSRFSPWYAQPWREHGDGHPNEWLPEDQTCWGGAVPVPLSRETADVDQDDNTDPARVGAMAHRPHNEAPVVYLHTELCGLEANRHVRAPDSQEARALAEALTAAADEVDGIKQLAIPW
jgi:hypothetical protein